LGLLILGVLLTMSPPAVAFADGKRDLF
jgi:hypothetical protein